MHVFFAVHYLQFFYLFDLLVVLSTDTALKTIFLLQICAVCFRILYSLFLDVLPFTDSLLYALVQGLATPGTRATCGTREDISWHAK